MEAEILAAATKITTDIQSVQSTISMLFCFM